MSPARNQPVDPLDGDNVPGLDFGAGHGTFVTGTLRQVAPMCTVRQYRVVGTGGLGNAWVLMLAILQAAADGCHIINLSLGFDSLNIPGGVSTTAVLQAISPQVLVVAAAGNGGDTTPIYPAGPEGGDRRRGSTHSSSPPSGRAGGRGWTCRVWAMD